MTCMLMFLILILPNRTRNYKTRYVTVPKGHIWVEGDNERASQDSNFYGPVSCNTSKPSFVIVIDPRSGSNTSNSL